MLHYLKVSNFAVIKSVELEFQGGFTCLTGETGAGKSLIVGALGLLSGKRVSSDAIRTGAERAFVEAVFSVPESCDLSNYELLEDRELILRREVTQKGRSRAFINGVMVPNQLLSTYAGLVFEIHGQHGQQNLMKEALHLQLFDRHVNLQSDREALDRKCSSFMQQFRSYWDAVDNEGRLLKELDFVQLQIAEIDAVAPSKDDEEIDTKLKIAENAELIRMLKEELIELVNDTLSPATRRLLDILEKLWEFEPVYKAYGEQLAGFNLTFEELRQEIQNGLFDESDEEALTQLRERSNRLNQLYLKYGANLEAVLDERTRLNAHRKKLQNQTGGLNREWNKLCEDYVLLRAEQIQLNDRRKQRNKSFETELSRTLELLSFPQSAFCNRWQFGEWPESLPADRSFQFPRTALSFLFSPNLGEEPKALKRVASGGELSRVMLALIVSLSRERGKTLVFDEVDAGLGGETAGVVGEKLASLGVDNQVLCVTHLAQVARYATSHWLVQKSVKKNRTESSFSILDAEKRVIEIARLLGGNSSAEGLLLHARKMLE
ncbi:MAG: hypothetical protein CR997_08700 [Acidobacteria bacterium]|nr:MAG: hypothetical protein CR997_08700 [Acidobacteriota bacterium]